MKLEKSEIPKNLEIFLKTEINNLCLSKMSGSDRNFLWNVIKTLRPKKLLELGIASGGSSAIILNAIADIEGAKLHSSDVRTTNAINKDENIMFFVEKEFPELMYLQTLYVGHDISKSIDSIGGEKFDFAFIDTAHYHPCETLNLLTILPFMKENSWVVLHDIGACFCREGHFTGLKYYASKYIWDVWVGEKISSDKCELFTIPNIGAIKIENLAQNKKKLLDVLLNRWDMDIPSEMLIDIHKIIKKYYTKDELEYFELIINRKKFLHDIENSKIKKVTNNVKTEITKNFGPFKKIISQNGRRRIYFCGIKIASY